MRQLRCLLPPSFLSSSPGETGATARGREQGHARKPHAARSPQGEHRTGEYVGEAAPLQRSGPEPGWGTFTGTRRGIQAKTEDTASSPLMALRTAARRAPLGPQGR